MFIDLFARNIAHSEINTHEIFKYLVFLNVYLRLDISKNL